MRPHRSSSPARVARSLVGAVVLGGLASGCTAGRATYFLLNAERQYQAALDAGAEERAVYEITLAREYLWKAKEEANSSGFGAAEQLSKKSATWSLQAIEESEDRGAAVRRADEFVPEERPEVPPTPRDETPIDIDVDDY